MLTFIEYYELFVENKHIACKILLIFQSQNNNTKLNYRTIIEKSIFITNNN